MSALALPDPENVRPAELPALIEQTQAALAHIDDIAVLWDGCGRANAISRFLRRSRQHNADVVYTDLLIRDRIGELLGSAAMGRPTEKFEHAQTLDPRIRHECRAIHAYRALWLGTRPQSIRDLLIKIERAKLAEQSPHVESSTRVGDFRDVLADLPDESVDLIFTDPPYNKQAVELYGDLAEFAARVLKPGGSVMAYCGQYALPQILVDMEGYLRFWWLCACVHEGGNHKSLPGIKAYVLWKPIVWFVKGTNASDEFVYDAILRPAPDKTSHDWAQALDEPLHYIEKLCPPGGLVCDPFAGGGTTQLAAEKLGRRFVGAELDPEQERIATGRQAA